MDLRTYYSAPSFEVLTGFNGDSFVWDGKDFDRDFASLLVQDFAEELGRSVPYKWLKGYLADPGSVGLGGGNYLAYDLEGNLFSLNKKVDEPYLPYNPKEALQDCLSLLIQVQRTSAA